MLITIFKKFFDYEITGEYLEKIGANRYQVKYIKKYHLKRKKKRERGRKCSH